MNDILTVKEVATYLRVSRSMVWCWCREGPRRNFRLGNVYRIHREELERHVASLGRIRNPNPKRPGSGDTGGADSDRIREKV